MHNFAAAGGMADMNGIFQVQMRRNRRQIIGIMIHVMAASGLGGTAMAAPVMSDAAVTMRGQEEHLIFECIRRERPAVAEDYRLPGVPIVMARLALPAHDWTPAAGPAPTVIIIAAGALAARGMRLDISISPAQDRGSASSLILPGLA